MKPRLRLAVALALLLGAIGIGYQWLHSKGESMPRNHLLDPQTGKPRFTNRLIHATSPYLLQHAHNPVDWYEWGSEAFEKAAKEDKPIFLSIGYAACHWCHVMEHESFENESIAKIMNENFVCIKVDREERPDVDSIYMTAVQLLTQGGGWPMSVWLLPDRRPFYGGTYFPPEGRWGRPGFRQVLLHLAELYRNECEKCVAQANELEKGIKQFSGLRGHRGTPSPELLEAAADELAGQFDTREGGFGRAPKFPPSVKLRLLLRYWKHSGNPQALQMVSLTLDKMASGGMYDQLGGGFHRYSTDSTWLVPHFEKMLYDNALLVPAYLDAFQTTGKAFYARVTRDALDYVLREMTSPEGGFYSTQDADSNGEEGKFFVWTPDQIEGILGARNAEILCNFYDVTRGGNFEHGRSILHITRSVEEVAKKFKLSGGELQDILEESRKKLFAAREKRVKPALDDKVLTSWNGLMISAMCRGYQVLGDERYLNAARRAAEFVFRELQKDGRLLRSWRGGKAHLNAYLDDYAFTAAACIDLYESSFEVAWLHKAQSLAETMLEHYWSKSDGVFFFTSDDHEQLIIRSIEAHDGAIPSGNSVAALALERLGILLGNQEFSKKSRSILEHFTDMMTRMPGATANMLCAFDFAASGPKELAVIGPRQDPATEAILKHIWKSYLPNRVIAFSDPSDPGAKEIVRFIPLLQAKTAVASKPSLYVCRNYACQAPLTDLGAIKAELEQ